MALEMGEGSLDCDGKEGPCLNVASRAHVFLFLVSKVSMVKGPRLYKWSRVPNAKSPT